MSHPINLEAYKQGRYSKKGDTVAVRCTTDEVLNSDFDTQKDMVRYLFFDAGFVVVNFDELKYFNMPWGFRIEGTTNKSLLSR